jgi:uncharacterized protein YjbJ (UPF0337 family)
MRHAPIRAEGASSFACRVKQLVDAAHLASDRGENKMGNDDKVSNKTDSVVGKAKETVGDAVGNESMESEGKKDQSKADLKQAGEKVKDAFKK